MSWYIQQAGTWIVAFTLWVAVLGTYWPYVEYAAFRDYIIENLCANRDLPDSDCQGKCHLEKQLNRQHDTGNQGEEAPVPDKKEKPAIDYFISNTDRFYGIPKCCAAYNGIIEFYSFLTDRRFFHPPNPVLAIPA